MIDDQSPAGSWQRHIDLMASRGKKEAPVDMCVSAKWHYDPVSVCESFMASGRKHYIAEITIQAVILIKLQNDLHCMVTAVPNGTWTPSFSARGRAKKEGVRTGYPDLVIDGTGPNAGKVFRAEIKAGSGVSLDQFRVLSALEAAGHHCGVFRSYGTLASALVARGWL